MRVLTPAQLTALRMELERTAQRWITDPMSMDVAIGLANMKNMFLTLDEEPEHEVHITTDGEGNAIPVVESDFTSAEQRVAQSMVERNKGWDGRVGPIEDYDL